MAQEKPLGNRQKISSTAAAVAADAAVVTCRQCGLEYCDNISYKKDSIHHEVMCIGPKLCVKKSCGKNAEVNWNGNYLCMECLGLGHGRQRPPPAVTKCANCGAASKKAGFRLPVCNDCGRARYCDSWCQREHWPTHKPHCRETQEANDAWRETLTKHGGFGPEVDCAHQGCVTRVRVFVAARCPWCARAYCSDLCRREDAAHHSACAPLSEAPSAVQEAELQSAMAASLAAAATAAVLADYNRAIWLPLGEALHNFTPSHGWGLLGLVPKGTPKDIWDLANRAESTNDFEKSLRSHWYMCLALFIMWRIANLEVGLTPESIEVVKVVKEKTWEVTITKLREKVKTSASVLKAAGDQSDWRIHFLRIAFETMNKVINELLLLPPAAAEP